MVDAACEALTMQWSDVGQWIKNNGGHGASLVGSLLTGNLPAAVASGIAMVSSATGTDSPEAALRELQSNPAAVIRLREISLEDDKSTRAHIEAMARAEMEDSQHAHHETQETIRGGDRASDRLIRWIRPGQSTLSLLAGIAYVWQAPAPDPYALTLLFSLPGAYFGLREFGKGAELLATRRGRRVS
ncbi:hypothetical protein [Haematospirillum jordaniae]|nr:hypothetical protein [Haematospirillum jordaniae]NKD67877.1 hypothetical protein [Haematospirillum jordaniae]NKD86662.1 hypothetical protein [Haematospirillum jordaniae]